MSKSEEESQILIEHDFNEEELISNYDNNCKSGKCKVKGVILNSITNFYKFNSKSERKQWEKAMEYLIKLTFKKQTLTIYVQKDPFSIHSRRKYNKTKQNNISYNNNNNLMNHNYSTILNHNESIRKMNDNGSDDSDNDLELKKDQIAIDTHIIGELIELYRNVTNFEKLKKFTSYRLLFGYHEIVKQSNDYNNEQQYEKNGKCAYFQVLHKDEKVNSYQSTQGMEYLYKINMNNASGCSVEFTN
jgi:hypothetical protein